MSARIHIISIVIIAFTVFSHHVASAQDPQNGVIILSDTLGNRHTHLTSPIDSVLHDSVGMDIGVSIGGKNKRNGLVKFINKILFINTNKRPKLNKQVVDETKLFDQYNGKTIEEVTFDRHDVFEDKRNWFSSVANGMHIRTLPGTIERDMLFKPGDTFNSSIVVMSNRLLLSRSYISSSWIEVTVNPEDTTKVSLNVVSLDNWTIGVDGEHRAGNRAMFNIYDVNFLGSGDKVGLKTYAQYKKMNFGGNVLDYVSPNFFGTFYTAKINAGRDFENSRVGISINKEFILPTDYELGASYANNKENKYAINMPGELARMKIRSNNIDIWAGRSKLIPSIESSLYFTGHYSFVKYTDRPEDTNVDNHSLFHNYDEIMFATGFYKERFYSSSMIYGYGFHEYITAGHKFELVGGYSWQEFGNYWYVGANGQRGGFSSLGYFMGRLSIGTHIDKKNGSWWRSAVNFDGLWFSNLWAANRRNQVRQFITLRYTRGWNMGTGAGALIRFNKEVRPVSFDTYTYGSNRLLLNTETVVFTHFKPLGFRLAIFGFVDAGLIGEQNNPFRNDLFSTFGIGIRFKNERMIFSAFQLRLGFSVGKKGFLKNNMFSGSVEQRMNQYRFIPVRPERVNYE